VCGWPKGDWPKAEGWINLPLIKAMKSHHSSHDKAAIHCAACGQDSFLLRQPQYEGFTRTGETLLCAACGHVYAGEAEVPFLEKQTPVIFTEEDLSRDPNIFSSTEIEHLCRHCAYYVVNPFMQWCGRHRREAEATGTCDQFETRLGKKDIEL
jgi:hypothetical protein